MLQLCLLLNLPNNWCRSSLLIFLRCIKLQYPPLLHPALPLQTEHKHYQPCDHPDCHKYVGSQSLHTCSILQTDHHKNPQNVFGFCEDQWDCLEHQTRGNWIRYLIYIWEENSRINSGFRVEPRTSIAMIHICECFVS